MPALACPHCGAELVLPRRGNGRLAKRVRLQEHDTKPDTIVVACPVCGRNWEVANARVVIFVARPVTSGG